MKEKQIHRLKKAKQISWIYFFPILFIIAFIPLVMKAKIIHITGISALFWVGPVNWVDFFCYWKSISIVIFTSMAILIYIGLFIDKKVNFKTTYKYYIPLIVYSLFSIISSALCYNKEIALYGFVDSYQGIFIILSYIALTFLMINLINSEYDVLLSMKAFKILIFVEGIICILQFIGLDFFSSTLGKWLISGDGINASEIQLKFGKGTMYATMYNTNFVGSFATLVVPLSIAFYSIAKTKKEKIFSFILITLSICIWVGCNSRAGYVGLIVAAILSIALLKKNIIKHKRFTLLLLLIIFIIIIVFDLLSGGRTIRQFSRLNIFKEVKSIESNTSTQTKTIFKNLELFEDSFLLETNKESLIVGYDKEAERFYVKNNYNEILDLSKNENGRYSINDPTYSNYILSISEEHKNIGIKAYNRNIIVYFTKEGTKVLGCGSRLTDPIVAPKFKLLNNYDNFASNRGYIWSRSIMLLPDTIIKGFGPDNYCIAFPQDDFIAKLNTGMDAPTVIDKPHNMYLQIAINTGIISLIALLVLWIIYIFRGLKLYNNMVFDSTYKCIGFACLISVIGYLVAGIFNDQVVSVAPLFWIILGIGISINETLINDSRINCKIEAKKKRA